MNFPKFFLCNNLEIPNTFFVLHINYPKFLIEFPDEKIIWLENELDEFTRLEYKNILNEAIDWVLAETTKINNNNINSINEIKKNFQKEFIKKLN